MTNNLEQLNDFCDNTQLVEFARSHAFAGILRAFKDPEYAIVGMGELADRIVDAMRKAGDTTEEVPISECHLTVVDGLNNLAILHVGFYWAHTEDALNSLSFGRTGEAFIPMLRDNDAAPLLRIIGLCIDEDYFSEWAYSGLEADQDDFGVFLQHKRSQIDPEWLLSRRQSQVTDDDGESPA